MRNSVKRFRKLAMRWDWLSATFLGHVPASTFLTLANLFVITGYKLRR